MATLPDLSTNLAAFLDTLAFSEGTVAYGTNDGYDVIVGGQLFTDYSKHPDVLVHLSPTLASTAAGRYQLMARYYEPYRAQLGLPDFSPESQDAIAVQQIKECHALPLIEAGHIAEAIPLCAHIWASLPGAGYGQHENKLQNLLDHYTACGGTLA